MIISQLANSNLDQDVILTTPTAHAKLRNPTNYGNQ